MVRGAERERLGVGRVTRREGRRDGIQTLRGHGKAQHSPDTYLCNRALPLPFVPLRGNRTPESARNMFLYNKQ